MRFLLINNHCISDPTAGVTQSLRTIMEWLADAGHACHILTTARFESAVTFTIEDHLRAIPHKKLRSSDRRYEYWHERYKKYKKRHPDRSPAYYDNRDQWTL